MPVIRWSLLGSPNLGLGATFSHQDVYRWPEIATLTINTGNQKTHNVGGEPLTLKPVDTQASVLQQRHWSGDCQNRVRRQFWPPLPADHHSRNLLAVHSTQVRSWGRPFPLSRTSVTSLRTTPAQHQRLRHNSLPQEIKTLTVQPEIRLAVSGSAKPSGTTVSESPGNRVHWAHQTNRKH